jgi:hypothetical protein
MNLRLQDRHCKLLDEYITKGMIMLIGFNGQVLKNQKNSRELLSLCLCLIQCIWIMKICNGLFCLEMKGGMRYEAG